MTGFDRHLSVGRRGAVFTVAVTLLLVVAETAAACPVCFGESDSPMVRGAELSILFMLGLTYVLILGGVAAFLILRRRGRRAEPTASPLGVRDE